MLLRPGVVDQVVHALDQGQTVLLLGERGSGRTSTVRAVAQRRSTDAARGTGLRMVKSTRFALDVAQRGEEVGDALLVVEDVQWADGDSLAALDGHVGPLLLTGLFGTEMVGATTVALEPLCDDEARALVPDLTEDALGRAGGNVRLLTTLVEGTIPSGVAARTLRGLWERLDDHERQDALLSGLSPAHLPRPRVGALGELAVALADEPTLLAAHEHLADRLNDPGDRVPHLLALGRDDEAAASAIIAARQAKDPAVAARLLQLIGPLNDDARDLLAVSLWRSGDLDGLVAQFPAPVGDLQAAVVLKACTAKGRSWPGEAPAGTRARARFAEGELVDTAPDVDGLVAVACSAVARGERPSLAAKPEDEEQAWQLAALATMSAWLHRDPLPAVSGGGPLLELLTAAVTTERDGATAQHAEHLATLLASGPAPAWGFAALAVCHADLGNAQEARAALDAAAPHNATDRHVLALARAEVELATGRPRRALKALSGQLWWPVLQPYATALEDAARFEVGEPLSGRAVDWHGISARRHRLQRWAGADVAGLRALEDEAKELGLLPLLARTRESLRRRGEKLARTTTAAEGAGALSPREVDVLGLVREGLTSAQIATRLGVAQSTVETQVASAMRKLGARTRRHAVALLAAVTP